MSFFKLPPSHFLDGSHSIKKPTGIKKSMWKKLRREQESYSTGVTTNEKVSYLSIKILLTALASEKCAFALEKEAFEEFSKPLDVSSKLFARLLNVLSSQGWKITSAPAGAKIIWPDPSRADSYLFSILDAANFPIEKMSADITDITRDLASFFAEPAQKSERRDFTPRPKNEKKSKIEAEDEETDWSKFNFLTPEEIEENGRGLPSAEENLSKARRENPELFKLLDEIDRKTDEKMRKRESLN